MADSVITAAIGAAGAVLGAVLGATLPSILNAKRNQERFTDVDRSRQDALDGEWDGNGKDFYVEKGGEFLEFQLTAKFKTKSGRLLGEVRLLDADGPSKHVELIMEGGFYDNDFVQLSYRSKNPLRKHMGVIVLKLSEIGDTLAGHYAGFSPQKRQVCGG